MQRVNFWRCYLTRCALRCYVAGIFIAAVATLIHKVVH